MMKHTLITSLCLLTFLMSACAMNTAPRKATPEQNPASTDLKATGTAEAQGHDTTADRQANRARHKRYYELEVESVFIDGEEIPVIKDDTPLSPQEEQALLSEPSIRFDLDPSESAEMQLYFKYFTRDHRAVFERWLERSQAYLPHVRKVFLERGLPEELIYLPFAESGYNPFAYSWAGAGGMWQFMPYTGKMFGLKVDWWVDERRSPEKSTKAAADYLTKLYGMFGDWYLALAAYNAGEGRISRAMVKSGCDNFFDLAREPKSNLAKETQHYVPKFLAILKIVHNLERLGFRPINWETDVQTAELLVPGGSDLHGLARAAGLSWQEFTQLNPIYRRTISPPESKSTVLLPTEKLAAGRDYLNSPESKPFASLTRYKMAKKDSMGKIATRFGVPLDVLTRINPGRGKPGDIVMIPSPGQGPDAKLQLADNSKARPSKSEKAVIRELTANRANYLVKKGDTAYSLAKKFNVETAALLKANGMTSAREIKAGTRLFIPEREKSGVKLARVKPPQDNVKSVKKADARQVQGKPGQKSGQLCHQVKNGDTLYGIAQKYGVSTDKIIAWNKMSRKDVLRTGDSLIIFR